jgi:CO/xanthine dehydrogenase FAD-binding subunit
VGAVSDRPVRLASVEAALTGCPASDVVRAAPSGHTPGISPAGATGASAQYSERLTRVLIGRALEEAAARSGAAA